MLKGWKEPCMYGWKVRPTKLVVLCSAQRLCNYTTTMQSLEVRKVAFLTVKTGLTSSKQMRLHKWHAQIHSLCASLSKIYYMIKSLRNVTSTQMICSTYFAYFQSRLRYGIVLGMIWKIYKDISATKKGYSINHCCT